MDVSLQAGRVVGEHWRLQRRLGSDAASRFWEAEDLRGGAHVAIEFACADVSGPDARLQFSRETRAFLKFRHPNVAQTLHRGIAGDSLAFAVSELLCGEDLVARLAREPALGLSEAAQILDVVCRVVNRFEASNLPQRVVEPKAVFFAVERVTTRVVKLLHTGLPRAGSRAGSPYVSPERASSAACVAPIDAAAQVWSIGVLGYRMVAGELPFAPGTRELDPAWASRLARLGEHRGELPPELDEWFRTAIHRDPRQRFASVEQAGLAFGHIATTYALNAVRVRREHAESREAAAGSVVSGTGRIVESRGNTGQRAGRRVADESGVVRVALPQPAVSSSSFPPAAGAHEPFPLGQVPTLPSLARRGPEARGGQLEVTHTEQARVPRDPRSRQRAAIAGAIVLGMLGGFALRSAILFVEEHSRATAALRIAVPPHSFAPAAPGPAPIETPASASQPSAAAPESEPAAEPAAQPESVKLPTDSPPRANPPRELRPEKRLSNEAPASELIEGRARPLISSRTDPSSAQLAATHEWPRGPAARVDALLPAAPPPIDTTPIQVYRGF